MAFRKKADYILKHKPDILIIPECEHPSKIVFRNRKKPTSTIWFGENQHKGLAVFSFNDYQLFLLPEHNPSFKIILPIKVVYKQTEMLLFAIWANNPTDKGYEYNGQIWKALKEYEHLLDLHPILLAGDFNSNTIWDKPKRIHNHTALVEKLAKQTIKSTYHHFFNQIQGREKHPTQYMYRHENKPYHLDYCFASEMLVEKLSKVKIGRYKNWAYVSDHMPVMVNFEL